MARHWSRIAFLCVYANQDVYRLLGRDPDARPLTTIETQLFYRCVLRHKEAEFTPREDLQRRRGLPSGAPPEGE